MIEIRLPKKLVDRYRLDWYRLSISENWCYIKRMHAIYYINTPYEDLFPGERGGAPLVDDWMIYEDDHPTGRWCGWQSPAEGKYFQDCFKTEKEASEEAIVRLNRFIEQKRERIEQIKKLITEVGQGGRIGQVGRQ